MNRAMIVDLLNQHRDQIKERFGVKHLALFGSAVRDEMHEGGDVDVLVEFEGSPTFDGYMNLKSFLEGLLATRVDLVTNSGLKSRARSNVERDLIRIA